jgi:hypothetical protein
MHEPLHKVLDEVRSQFIACEDACFIPIAAVMAIPLALVISFATNAILLMFRSLCSLENPNSLYHCENGTQSIHSTLTTMISQHLHRGESRL